MPTRSHLTLVVLALALVATGCSDDDATPDTTTPPAVTTSGATPTTTAETAPTTTEDDALAALLKTFEETRLRTTYLFADGSDQIEVTMSQDPTADPPVEAVLVPDADAKLITIGDETIFCDTMAGQCFTVPGAAGGGFSTGLLGPFAGSLFMAGQLDTIPGATVEEGEIEVAGRSGPCFTFTPPADAGFESETVRQCIDSELGFTLLVQYVGDGEEETIMELIEFGEPRDDDFTPTGPIVDSP